MRSRTTIARIAWASCLVAALDSNATANDQPDARPSYRISLEAAHPWRPPFGLDRIGRPVVIVIETATRPDVANFKITAFAKGKEDASYPVRFPAAPPYKARVT